MRRIATHLLESLLIIFCIITINFLLIRLMPGDPVEHILGEDEYLRIMVSRPEVIDEVRTEYGLDKSVFEQYTIYLRKTIQLDFGDSFRTKKPVLDIASSSLFWTLMLAAPATILAALLGGWLGLQAGWAPGKIGDSILSPIMMLILTVPTNCIAIIFLIIFSFKLGIFPLSGMTTGGLSGTAKALDILRHATLPMIILTFTKTASNFMLMRNTVLSIRNEEYVTVALSKGLGDAKVRRRHVMKNALCPYITSVCMQFGQILTGAILIETVFSWSGMGSLIYSSVSMKDYPMLQTCFLFIGICIIAFNLLGDAINMVLDPRIRREKDA